MGKFLPSSGFNFGDSKGWRTSTYDAHCGEPSIVWNVISISYSIHSYGAGAAHGMQHFRTFAFVLEPLTIIETFRTIFISDAALTALQNVVRSKLRDQLYGEEDRSWDDFGKEWIKRGTQTWDSFGSCRFEKAGLTLMFPPYQVASYAQGSHVVEVPYEAVIEHIRPEFRSALGIDYLFRQVSNLS